MRTRLALIECKTSLEGEWSRVKGNELGLRISTLVKGEFIRLDIVDAPSIFFRESGAHPVGAFANAKRYRVSKEVDHGVTPTPTTVEVLLHG